MSWFEPAVRMHCAAGLLACGHRDEAAVELEKGAARLHAIATRIPNEVDRAAFYAIPDHVRLLTLANR